MKLKDYRKHLGEAVLVVPRSKKGGDFEPVYLGAIRGFLLKDGQYVIADLEVEDYFSRKMVSVMTEAEVAEKAKKKAKEKDGEVVDLDDEELEDGDTNEDDLVDEDDDDEEDDEQVGDGDVDS